MLDVTACAAVVILVNVRVVALVFGVHLDQSLTIAAKARPTLVAVTAPQSIDATVCTDISATLTKGSAATMLSMSARASMN